MYIPVLTSFCPCHSPAPAALTQCTASQYESKPATDTSDRECSELAVCGDNQFAASPPTATTNRVCKTCSPVSKCVAILFTYLAAALRECELCRIHAYMYLHVMYILAEANCFQKISSFSSVTHMAMYPIAAVRNRLRTESVRQRATSHAHRAPTAGQARRAIA